MPYVFYQFSFLFLFFILHLSGPFLRHMDFGTQEFDAAKSGSEPILKSVMGLRKKNLRVMATALSCSCRVSWSLEN